MEGVAGARPVDHRAHLERRLELGHPSGAEPERRATAAMGRGRHLQPRDGETYTIPADIVIGCIGLDAFGRPALPALLPSPPARAAPAPSRWC